MKTGIVVVVIALFAVIFSAVAMFQTYDSDKTDTLFPDLSPKQSYQYTQDSFDDIDYNNSISFIHSLSRQDKLDMYFLTVKEIIFDTKSINDSNMITKMITWSLLNEKADFDTFARVDWQNDFPEYSKINFPALFEIEDILSDNYSKAYDVMDGMSELEQVGIITYMLKKGQTYQLTLPELVILGYIGEKYPQIFDDELKHLEKV